MPVVEVPCPNCGAKLKAPDNMAGKKARCKKCAKTFRIPGTPVGESIGDADIPVADLVEDAPPVPAAPAKPVTVLPSADAFDFSKPKPSAVVPTPAAKPTFGATKPVAPPAPVAPAKPAPAPVVPATAKAAPPAPAKPVAVAPAPAAPVKPAAVAPAAPVKPGAPAPAPKPAPKPADPLPPPPAPAPAAEASDDMFAFGSEPAAPASKKKRRYDEDEDDRPRAKGREDEDDAPKKKRTRSDDEDEDEDDAPKKGKSKTKGGDDEPYNPFANYPVEPEPEPEKKPKKRKGDKGEGDEEDEPGKPRYLRPEEKGTGVGKAIMLTGVIGAIALALGVLATVVYIKNNRKPPEPEAKPPEGAPVAPGTPAGPVNEPPKGPVPIPDPPRPSIPDPPRPDPKPKDKVDPPKVDPPKVDPKGKDKADPPKVDPPKPKPKDPGLTRAAAKLPPNLRTFALGAPPAKGERSDPRRGDPTLMDTPMASVVRMFPPTDAKTGDTLVLIRTSPALMGKGEKLALDTYGKSGNLVPTARIEYDGDGSTEPIADVFGPSDAPRFLAASDGKLHVWNVTDKKKLADGLDPYADKPEHAAAGLAAAFLTADPNQVITVSTAGAVHLYDLRDRKAVSEAVPPHGAPGKVALGPSVAKDDTNGSVAVAVGGIVYQYEAKPGLKELRKIDLGGDVGRSLALAASGAPGRLMYAFEAVADGKKEKAVLDLPLVAPKGGGAIVYRFPDALGDPKGALWAGDLGGLIIDRGVVWFDDRENRFVPAFAMQPPVPYLYAGNDGGFWCVASQANGAKSALISLAVPFNDFTEPVKGFPAQPLRVYRLTPNGLEK